MVFGKSKTHTRGKSDQSVVMQLANGQYLITLPKNVASFKGIKKGMLLKWSDAGPGRIQIEIIN